MNTNTSAASNLSVFIVALGIACAEFSTNVTAYLLPALRDHFSLTDHQVSWAVAMGLISVGVSGLGYGVCSDFMGRRKLYLVSLLLYGMGTLGMLLATSFPIFLLGRFFQGLGSGSAWVIGTALLRDLAQTHYYRQHISFLHVTSGIVRGCCPLIGALLFLGFGWRANYLLLLALSVGTWLLFFCFQQETKSAVVFSKQRLQSHWKSLQTSFSFKYFLIIKVLCVMAIFVMLAKLPLILNALGVSSLWSGKIQAMMFCCFVVGTLLGERWAKVMPLVTLILRAILSGLGACLVMSWSSDLIVQLLSYGVCFVVWGIVFANATSQIVGSRAEASGFASSMMMCLEMTLGGGVVVVSGYFAPTFLTCSLFVGFLLAIALWWGTAYRGCIP